METPEKEVAGATPPNEPAVEQVPHKPKAKKASKPKTEKKSTHIKLDAEDIEIGPKDYDRVVLPETEDDPHWDPKLKNPVPEGLVDGLSEFGWDPSSRAIAIRDGKNLKVIHGKTRWRALDKANRRRKAEGLEPITAYLRVVDEDPGSDEQIIGNMRLNVRLNRHVQDIDPMTLAESIVRALSANIPEKQVADDHAISVSDLHGYLLLTDEDKCPPVVQELVRAGKVPFGAALELARRSANMTKAEMTQAAEQVAKVSAGGVKITAAQVKKAAGVKEDGPATQKQKKQLILDIQSGEFKGAAGEAAKWAAILACEVGLGTRTVDSFWTAFGKVAKGQTIRVDFKQYQTEKSNEEKPVKGQK